jgi:ABC-type nitrate/sulfonate/bicarbonate transport system substrate-binding protein
MEVLVDKRAAPKLSSRPMKRAAVFLTSLMILTVSAFIPPTDAEIVHMGLSGIGLYELPSELAKRRGFYEQEKLEVRKVTVGVGIQVAALFGGRAGLLDRCQHHCGCVGSGTAD